MLARFKVHVVGVSFIDGYPHNLFELQKRSQDGPVKLRLEPEPSNPFDGNAVLVCCEEMPIGHVPAGLASRLSPMLADGTEFSCVLDEVLVSSEAPERPGVVISCERADLCV